LTRPEIPPADALPGLDTIQRVNGETLTYQQLDGDGPTRIWLPGFMSDMGGTKAAYLAARAGDRKTAFLRFDYAGCGLSKGRFEDGTIGGWLDDTLLMIDAVARGPLVLIGSSMGGWLALLAARARPERVKALVLIAPAPDFTERLMWPNLPEEARAAILEAGVWHRPSAYGDGPYPITRALIEDGRRHLLLDGPIPFDGPVRIVHGQEDPDVPWRLSLELADKITSRDVQTLFIKHGDHRLSTPADLAVLDDLVEAVAARAAPILDPP
jgi:pimeloyl-ACP methyl ester carboxylesterase